MDCGGLYVSADFLYWRAENNGWAYAYEQETTVPAGLNVGNIVRISPDWDPGFRIGLGWNTTHDFWDVLLNYTWYRNKTSESKTSENGFFPFWPSSFAATSSFDAAKARTQFQMNMGDLEVGRMVFLTKTLAVRPHWGAKGGTLNQKFNSSFSAPRVGILNSEQKFSGKNNYWGVGPRAGVNTEFHLNQGFSIKGNFAGALLYGKNRTRSRTTVLAVGDTEFTTERDYTDDFYQLVPHVQLALGFQWQTCFWCEKMLYKMSVMWETNFWWNQFQLPTAVSNALIPINATNTHPLTMEGLTLNFEWGF